MSLITPVISARNESPEPRSSAELHRSSRIEEKAVSGEVSEGAIENKEETFPAEIQQDRANATGQQAKERGSESPPLQYDSTALEESAANRLERLGRQRPDVFLTIWSEIGFIFSISMSQVLTVCIFLCTLWLLGADSTI